MDTKNRNTISISLIIIMLSSVFALPLLSENFNVDAASSKCKVTFKANGGKFKSNKKTHIKKIKKNKSISKLPKPTKKGHKLKGWYTKKKGGKKVTKKTKFKKNTKLYAKWTPKIYSVHFDFGEPDPSENGDLISSTESKPVKYGHIIGEMPSGEKEGQTFLGWFTSKTGGKQMFPNTIFKYTKNIVLYARYENK